MVCLSGAALVRRLYVMCDPLLKGDVCYCSNGTAFRVPPASLPGSHSPGTGKEGRAGPYPSCNLLGKGLHQCLHTVVHEHGGVVEELLIAVLLPLDDEGVGHQPMPVIELVELHRDAIPVLELCPKQQFGVELEAEEVPAEVLDIIFNDNLNGLPWAGGERSSRQLCTRVLLPTCRGSASQQPPPRSSLTTALLRWLGIFQ